LFSSSVTFRKLLINDIRGTGDMTTVSLFWSVCSTTLIERCKVSVITNFNMPCLLIVKF
jgi:hypothetical protein